MMKIGLVGLLVLAGAISLAAAAQGTSREVYAAKKADCTAQADAKDFGIHLYQRDRFVVRCIAGLSH
jgi:hypothetical protein